MLPYQMIKRRYKLNDTNIADFFGYKNRTSFATSTLRGFITSAIERAYDQYRAGGVKGAADYISKMPLPGSEQRQERYLTGLLEFVDTINSQERKGKVRDPLNSPYNKGKKYKPVK